MELLISTAVRARQKYKSRLCTGGTCPLCRAAPIENVEIKVRNSENERPALKSGLRGSREAELHDFWCCGAGCGWGGTRTEWAGEKEGPRSANERIVRSRGGRGREVV